MPMTAKQRRLLIALAKLSIHSTSGGDPVTGQFDRSFLDKAKTALADMQAETSTSLVEDGTNDEDEV